jgi:hypothetical protein
MERERQRARESERAGVFQEERYGERERPEAICREKET